MYLVTMVGVIIFFTSKPYYYIKILVMWYVCIFKAYNVFANSFKLD